MPRWQYMAESLPAGANGHMEAIVDRLNDLGVDGWEAIDMRWLPVSQYLTITLKRERSVDDLVRPPAGPSVTYLNPESY